MSWAGLGNARLFKHLQDLDVYMPGVVDNSKTRPEQASQPHTSIIMSHPMNNEHIVRTTQPSEDPTAQAPVSQKE